MAEYVAFKRTTRVISPEDDRWRRINQRLQKNPIPFSPTWFSLLFRPRLTVTSPPEVDCPLTNLSGRGLFLYKELDGNTYYLQPKPSPGFPGS